jgi:hypothetical protein
VLLLACSVGGRLYGVDITTHHWQDKKFPVVGIIFASHQHDVFDTTPGDFGATEAALCWGVRRPTIGSSSTIITGFLYNSINNINNSNNIYYDPSLFFIIVFLLLIFASQPIFTIFILGLDRSEIRGHSRRPDRYEIYP